MSPHNERRGRPVPGCAVWWPSDGWSPVERNGPACRCGAVLRCAESRQRGTAVAAEGPRGTRVGKRAPKRGAVREAEAMPTAAPERRFVDIDPWAMLLEGLTNMPEEEPVERKGGKGE